MITKNWELLELPDQHESSIISSKQPSPVELKYLLGLQRQLLLKIANNDDLDSIVDCLSKNIENAIPNGVVVALLKQENNTDFKIQGYPNIQRKYYPLLQPISSIPCSFIASAIDGQPHFVSDTRTHSDWQQQQTLIKTLPALGCWSYPIFSANDRPVGSISIFNKNTGYPSTFTAQLLETAAYILSVAVTGHRNVIELAKTEAQLQNITHSLPVTVLQIKLGDDEKPDLNYYSEGLHDLFGMDSTTRCSFDVFWQHIDPHNQYQLIKKFKKNNSLKASYNQEFSINTKTQSKKWVYLSATIEIDQDSQLTTVNCMLMDISTDKINRQQLELSNIAFNSTSEGIMVADAKHNIVNLNAAYLKMSGFSSSDLIGKHTSMICPWQKNNSEKRLKAQRHWHGEVSCRRQDGEVYFQRVTISAVATETNSISHYVYVAADVSGIKESEQKLLYMQQHDILTGLPNRLLFKSLLEHEIKECHQAHIVAVLMLDLDRFKHVNESLGHKAGDQLLCLVAQRLNKTLEHRFVIARVGGDEFAILLTGMKNKQHVVSIAEQIISAMEHPFNLEDYSFYTTGTIGISLFPEHSTDSETLIKNADAAVHHSKNNHRNNFAFYHFERSQVVESWVRLESALRQALVRDEFEVYFQPQINALTQKITGAETLIRWRHPEEGLLSPDKFLPILEAIGLMPEVGGWVLEQACHHLAKWRDKFDAPFKIAVNVSSQQLLQGDLLSQIRVLIQKYKLSPKHIELEILETVIMEYADEATPLLKKLRAMGVSLALDDFGTGHSSLSYLTQLPVHKLKIDKSMTQDIQAQAGNNAIVGAVIALGHKLGMTICAEGVENDIQRAFLSTEGCDQLQGYFFAKPMPAPDFEHWLVNHLSQH